MNFQQLHGVFVRSFLLVRMFLSLRHRSLNAGNEPFCVEYFSLSIVARTLKQVRNMVFMLFAEHEERFFVVCVLNIYRPLARGSTIRPITVKLVAHYR